MTHVDLPRPIEAYFAFAELPPSRDARRFTITLTYLDGGRLDRLQWWWQAGNGQLRVTGEAALAGLRREAAARFRSHVETWLVNSNRRLSGGNPFPQLDVLPAPVVEPASQPATASVPAHAPPAAPAGVVPLGAARKGQAA